MQNLIEIRSGDDFLHNITCFCASVEAHGTRLQMYDAAHNLTSIAYFDRATVRISRYQQYD